ncbi:MAG: helix-turn-helix domain-containing protein [Terriglobales bacterium]
MSASAYPTSLPERLLAIDRALTAPELATLLNVHKLTIYRAVKEGRLPAFRIFSCLRFDPRSVAQWLNERGLR